MQFLILLLQIPGKLSMKNKGVDYLYTLKSYFQICPTGGIVGINSRENCLAGSIQIVKARPTQYIWVEGSNFEIVICEAVVLKSPLGNTQKTLAIMQKSHSWFTIF